MMKFSWFNLILLNEKQQQADNFRKYKIKKIPKMDILCFRYSRKNKKTTESVIFRLYSKDIFKPMI